MRRVLVIEDDKDLADLIAMHLTDIGCGVTQESSGTLGCEKALLNEFDLIVLDVSLPGIDGVEVCRRLRAADVRWPILMLTARAEENDRILGLETGADDYVTKPFSIREFLARVKAIFRRAVMNERLHVQDPFPIIAFGSLVLDPLKRKLTLHGKRIELTPKEFDILQLLATHPGKYYTRQELLRIIWGYEFAGYEHTVNSHINRLRAKIQDEATTPKYILTAWGIGYRFNEEIQTHRRLERSNPSQ
jgi:two-component system alkaline phosphatase synthesis response regulator PhoP